MTQEERKDLALLLRNIADSVEAGSVSWYWIATKYKDGRTVKLATKDAPNRPGGM